MLILLPPSETKQARSRGRSLDLERLSFPELTRTREQVAQALATVSAGEDAAGALGVSPGLVDDIARNTRLTSAPALPAQDLYTGVLYDALDMSSLDTAALRRARRWIVVVSALYGALRPADKVAPYRLSMGVNLQGVGPLAGAWREPLDVVLSAAAGRGAVVDCRSSTYVAAWAPQGALAERWVQIRVPGATHMAKHTRGLLARHLCQAGQDARTPRALEAVAAQAFTTQLTEPARPGRPWVLDVTAR
ncbi:YaaA family protein [Luteipulveratus flavus]|uniref:Peroxide stress protein YaaA n=1 Tax=Luteipulveratus flavus TaxID=3031728 RepID=A0ABT6C3U5_9MICO|nr:peroxide stress protein YaaA [Luteipulveratus sp. YIM 133296]MDF8263430.1 peroxide stress protein YaaA [Luteipulveratus sp. YIM 133296]